MEYENLEMKGKSVSSMEDIIELAGTSGRWSWLVLVIASTISFGLAFQSLTYQFLGQTPDHWCLVEPLVEANWTQKEILEVAIPFNSETGKPEACTMYDLNYSDITAMGFNTTFSEMNYSSGGNLSLTYCSKRYFNSSDNISTVVTEWDLVCENRALYSTVQSITQIGYLVGSLIFGYLVDMYGRRPVSISCMTLMVVLKIIALFSPNVIFYIIIRGLASVCAIGCYLSNFIIALESSSPSQRSTVSALFIIPWVFGYMVVPGLAYFIQDWKQLHIALSVPYCLFLALYWLLPESLRWLLLQGRYKEALKLLDKMARVNKQALPSGTTILAAMERVAQREQAEVDVLSGVKSRNIFMDSQYRLRLIYLVLGWFACGMVYYGVSLNSTNLSANTYIYVFLGGLLELPVYILLWLWLNFRGRRYLMACLFFICGICIAALTSILLLVPNAPVAVMVFLSLCGKFSITAAFHLIWIYTAELFPTEYRSQAIGQGNVIGRIGSFCAPYINDILGEYTSWAPSATYAMLSLVAVFVMFLLPDSDGKNLPEMGKASEAARSNSRS